MIRIRTSGYQGLRKNNFSENFADLLNEWSLKSNLIKQILKKLLSFANSLFLQKSDVLWFQPNCSSLIPSKFLTCIFKTIFLCLIETSFLNAHLKQYLKVFYSYNTNQCVQSNELKQTIVLSSVRYCRKNNNSIWYLCSIFYKNIW